MSLHYYHPNSRVTGFAASFWYSDRDDSVFATLIKQAGWDANTQNGTFKDSLNDPNKKVNIKLSFTEVAAILDCVERNRPFTTFHDSDEKPKSISFTPWMSKDATPVCKGYSFSVTVTDKQDSSFKNAFYIGFSFAEAREIREFLIFIMHDHFYALRQRQQQMQSQSQSQPQAAKNQPQPANNQPTGPVKDSLTGF